MTPTLANQYSAATTGSSTTVATLTGVTAGKNDLLILMTFAPDPVGTSTSMSDGSNTYTRRQQQINSSGGLISICELWSSAISVALNSATITWTLPSAVNNKGMMALIFTNLSSPILDQTAGGNNNAPTTSLSGTATATTTTAIELIVGGFGLYSASGAVTGVSAGSGWTSGGSILQWGVSNALTLFMEYRNVSSTSTYRVSGTSTGTATEYSNTIGTFSYSPPIAQRHRSPIVNFQNPGIM